MFTTVPVRERFFNKSLQFSETFMTLNRTNRDNPRKILLDECNNWKYNS